MRSGKNDIPAGKENNLIWKNNYCKTRRIVPRACIKRETARFLKQVGVENDCGLLGPCPQDLRSRIKKDRGVSWMNDEVDVLYWQKNKEWYIMDDENDIFVIRDDAPDKAKKSLEGWKELQRKNVQPANEKQ